MHAIALRAQARQKERGSNTDQLSQDQAFVNCSGIGLLFALATLLDRPKRDFQVKALLTQIGPSVTALRTSELRGDLRRRPLR